MPRRRLRVLCFGDSLTAGYWAFGSAFHPYHEKFAEKLGEAFSDTKVEVDEDGLPGDLTGMFMGRILQYFGPKRDPYDWTIILGGTNDLGRGFPPERVFENLEKTWNVALLNKSKVLALTIPEAGVSARRETLDARRKRLNDLIKGYTRDNFYAFDFHDAFPFWGMSDEERDKYWDDGVHLKPDGYDLMGKQIAAELTNIIQNEPPTATLAEKTNGTSPRRKKAFKDDSLEFQEEGGDPGAINKGYIVVRKKDLD